MFHIVNWCLKQDSLPCFFSHHVTIYRCSLNCSLITYIVVQQLHVCFHSNFSCHWSSKVTLSLYYVNAIWPLCLQLFLYACVCEQLMQIDRINNIYKDHSFGICGSGFGFEIKQVGVPLFGKLHTVVFTSCQWNICVILLDITCDFSVHIVTTSYLIWHQRLFLFLFLLLYYKQITVV